MSLHGLSASELARIDKVCLEYELGLRDGNAPSIDELVANHGGSHAEILRRELQLVREEIGDSVAKPFDGLLESSRVDDTVAIEEREDIDPVKLPTPGTRIGPYVISSEIGRGGMGVVFAAVDTRLDRKVAIKVLAVEPAKSRGLSERFEREARAVAAISHPNIVELFDVGVAQGLPYAVMEFLHGEPLDQRLQRGAMPATEVRRIGAQIADALATAHAANVIHRDLKPQNVMIVPRLSSESSAADWSDSQGEPLSGADGRLDIKLFDFGLSRAPELAATSEETGHGVVMGTPGYMAPEQIRGERVTPAADIFSLGCILFEAFYGQRAFEGRTNTARFTATLKTDPLPVESIQRDDVELAALIAQWLQKQSDARPQSAGQIAQQLRTALIEPSCGEVARHHNAINRRRMLSLAAGGTCGALIGAYLARGNSNSLNGIGSLAVLALEDKSSDAKTVSSTPNPVGDREMGRGEQLSALLVHELTRVSEITVPRFRPLKAETQQEFRDMGQMLEVDAILTGSLRTARTGTKDFLELDLQIISSETGAQLWGKQFHTDSADNLLELSTLATEIASVIGHQLTSTAEEAAPPSVESFSCLVSGSTRSDPDSLRGLQMALSCFRKAHDADRGAAKPLAGIALTSITLAGQSDDKESIDLIRQARESAKEAIAIDPSSREARLALAMNDWQTLARYRSAERAFEELQMTFENDWQICHQYGLFQLATGRTRDAMVSLREASQLHPLSMSVKVDFARAHWYAGQAERAIQDAKRLRERYDNPLLARGLLIDIYEQQQKYDLAAAVDGGMDVDPRVTADDYFAVRRTRLTDVPYGAFGTSLNAAIMQSRIDGGFSDRKLADLTDPMPPMLPLLLSAHPSFASARALPRASEILPPRAMDSPGVA